MIPLVVGLQMLEINKTYSSTSHELEYGERQSGSLAEYLSVVMGILRRQVWVILLFLVLTGSAAGAYYHLNSPTYRATAIVSIDPRKFQLFQQSLGEVAIESSSGVESQLEILKSEKIALQVIEDLNLVQASNNDTPTWWERLFGSGPPKTDFERTRGALAWLQKHLTVKRLGAAWVIEISFESTDPARAAQIANAVADTYVADQLAGKYEATRQASTWLEGRIKELREQMLASQRAVVEFKASNHIVDAGGGRLMSEQQLSELNAQLSQARAQSAEARARLESITAIDQAASAASGDSSKNALLTGTLSNDTLTKLRAQLSELSSREAEFSAKYGANHQAVVNLRTQLAEIRSSMREEIHRLRDSYKNDYDLALKREKNLESDVAGAVAQSQDSNRSQVTLRELESSADAAKGMYDIFVKRFMESIEQQAFPVAEARVITRAVRPLDREVKTLLRNLAAICGAGLALGAGAVLLREYGDRVFRTVNQVEKRLNMNCIAIIPQVKFSESRMLARAEAEGPEHRRIRVGSGPMSVVIEAPLSAFAESVRSIKLAVDLNRTVKANKVIGLTSSLPKEGKSTIATSLALLIAQTGARVLLIDCDFRNPTLTRRLSPQATTGFLEVLAGRVPLSEALWNDETGFAAFLPAVVNAQFVQSNEIMASRATKLFFDKMRSEYDYVLVDLPPLAPVIDTRATTHLIDCYLFLVEWGETKVDIVEHALRRAPGVAENILGVVLNKVDLNSIGSYDNKNAGFYKNKLYSQYGDFG